MDSTYRHLGCQEELHQDSGNEGEREIERREERGERERDVGGEGDRGMEREGGRKGGREGGRKGGRERCIKYMVHTPGRESHHDEKRK